MKDFITQNKYLIISVVFLVSIIVLFIYVNHLYNRSLSYIQNLDERVYHLENTSPPKRVVRFVSPPVVNEVPPPIKEEEEEFDDVDLDKVVEEELENIVVEEN